MPKLNKLRKKKKFNYARNRSRVRKQQEKTTKFNVKVDCQAMRDVWDNRVSLKENMESMGVALDANSVVSTISSKKSLVNKMKKQKNKPVNEAVKTEVTKPEVLSKLSEDAKFEAKQTFRFTPTQVQLITYMMDKHGSDFSAMARDAKNHYQETANKIKGMVNKFISIPEHYAVYCRERGLITADIKDSEESDENMENSLEDEENLESSSDEE